MSFNVIKHKIQLAKKDHVCDYCNSKIYKGNKYSYSFINNSGDVYSFKCHESCGKLVDIITDEYDGINQDMFFEAVEDAYRKYMSKSFNTYYESKVYKDASFKDKLSFLKSVNNINID